VIRRGFWLTVGAAAGIMGYRRVSAVGRRLSGRLTGGGTHDARRTVGLARETVRFTRDVREGMELYAARHREPPGRTLNTTDHDPRPKDGR
jgi:hypothetical protein